MRLFLNLEFILQEAVTFLIVDFSIQKILFVSLSGQLRGIYGSFVVGNTFLAEAKAEGPATRLRPLSKFLE